MNTVPSTYQPVQSSQGENNEANYLTMRSRQTTADDGNALKVETTSLFFEGYSSETSINTTGYMDRENTDNTCSDIIVLVSTEPSTMFFTSVFLMVRHWVGFFFYKNGYLIKIMCPHSFIFLKCERRHMTFHCNAVAQ